MSSVIENKCIKKGVRLTDQRKLIAKVMSESTNHPNVDGSPESVVVNCLIYATVWDDKVNLFFSVSFRIYIEFTMEYTYE